MKPNSEYENKYRKLLKSLVLSELENKPCTVFLFGSRASGAYRWASDFDVGIEGLNEEEFLRIKFDLLDKIEESLIPWKVDIINFDTADQEFKKIALQDYEVWKSA